MNLLIISSHAGLLGNEIKGVAMDGHVICKGKREMSRTQPSKSSEMFLGNQAQNHNCISVNSNILFRHINNHFSNILFIHSGLLFQEM